MTPVNIAAHLPAMAARQPDHPAIIFAKSGLRWTFAELDAESDRVGRGLVARGITRGTRTVLMVPPGPEFFSLVFALFKIGAVPVVVDPGMGVKPLGRCLAEAEPEAFIGIPKAHVARILLRWARPTIRRLITVGRRCGWGGATLATVRRLGTEGAPPLVDVAGDETAAILFTSGSTGPPKGVVYSHATFAAQVRHLERIYGIEPGEVDLPTFPLFGLFDPALGMTAVIPDMDFTRPAHVQPENIIGPIRAFEATNMFGSPALLDRVGRWAADRDVRLGSLKRVISAGAPVPASALERFQRLLEDGAQVCTPYGATEALPVSNIGSTEILRETAAATAEGRGVCVGAPVDGVDVRIIVIDDDPIDAWRPGLEVPDGMIGEITVRGDVVTESYFRRDAATRLAKIRDADGAVRHRMGDVGYRDDLGRLWFCGRKSHRVQTASGTLYTVPCEGVFNAHRAVRRSALVGIGDPGAQRPVVCFELEPSPLRRTVPQLVEELRAIALRYDHTRTIDTFLVHDGFPVDIRHNAKIFREKLAVWAARKLGATRETVA